METRASFLALENGKDAPAPIFILTDSANHLTEVDNWVGEGKSPTLSKSKDSDILRAILELLHHRARKGFPTFFIKIREGEAPRTSRHELATGVSDVFPDYMKRFLPLISICLPLIPGNDCLYH